MTELLTAAQMRAIEQAAIESGEVTGLELMERAGRGVVEAIFEHWPELAKTSGRAVVLCGPGNNGGDGFVVARLLHDWGWDVQVLLSGRAEKLPPDARTNHDLWLERGNVEALSESTVRQKHPVYGSAYADIYIDALFGTGLTRPVTGEALNVLSHMSGRNGDDYVPYTVAIDAPSGLCLDSGRVLGVDASDQTFRGKCAAAALTVAFDNPKIGHFVGVGPALCGHLVVKDIGLADWRATLPLARTDAEPMRRGGIGPSVRPAKVTLITNQPMVKDARPHLFGSYTALLNKERGGSHKFKHGHALVLTGQSGKTGAARLAARGAIRIGAGLVTLGAPKDAFQETASQITAIMLDQIESSEDLRRVLNDPRFNALCLGPGLGLDRARHLVPATLSANRPTVLDADALSCFEDDADALFEMLHERCVLTPHQGEFARLFPDIADRLVAPKRPDAMRYIDYDPLKAETKWEEMNKWREELAAQQGPAFSKVDAAREAAKRAGCIVVFKGPDTIVAAPNGLCAVSSAHYDRAAPWLATAGSGDVLAGFISGLLARGFNPMQAAEVAVWLHVECALNFGPGLIAEDLPEQLPAVFKQMGV